MMWPLVGSASRLIIVAVGGWICVDLLHLPASGFFVVIAVSFAVYAGTLAMAIRLGGWSR